MTKTWAALGAAVAISAAAITHSTPAAAHEWGAAATTACHGAYYGGCCANEPRGLFTSGFFGGCGCGLRHPGYQPGTYYHDTHPYIGPYYRHFYRPYVRHNLYRHGVYHRHSAYHGHGVYRVHHHDHGHMHHW